jgi:hypothetical protein
MTLVRAFGFALLIAAVGLIYRDAAFSYFFNDDVQWLQGAWQFELGRLGELDRYDHFYRPAVEVYFYVAQGLFGCAALPFHLANIGMHFVNVLLLFAFARALTGQSSLGFLAAMFFAVQPGHVEAVAWVAAVTAVLPTTWFLLALWMHLSFLRSGRPALYAGSLAAFAACLLTHESAVTLLPMMIALEAALVFGGDRDTRTVSLGRRAAAYAPYLVLLTGYLAIAFVVNSRSYLVEDGIYAFGWHAVPNTFAYLSALYVGPRDTLSYLALALVLGALLWRGTPRTRFAIVWMFVTLTPFVFFTWENTSRYLYLPAAGFSMLLADVILKAWTLADRRLTTRWTAAAMILVVALLSGRFANFALEGTADFRERTRPYETFAGVVRAAGTTPDGVAVIDRDAADAIPDLYRTAAAQVAACRPDLRLTYADGRPEGGT